MARPSSSTAWKVVAAFVFGAIFGAFTVAQVAPNATTTTASQGPASSGGSSPGATNPTAIPTTIGTGPAGLPGSGGLPPTKAGLACAPGRNGGATDKGVTATSI